jgi:hypothetical protein
MSKDAFGVELIVGDKVVFSRQLWRGKSCLAKGEISSLSEKMASINVTSPPPDGIELYRGWSGMTKAKLTKICKL